MHHILTEIRENLIAGRIDKHDEGFSGDMVGQPGVLELVQTAIDQDISPNAILNTSLNPGMEEVGRRYESGEYLIPDMLASAECISEAMDLLEPYLSNGAFDGNETFIIATVEGDLHDIGKNIVATLLRGSGFSVEDLGTDVTAGTIVEAVNDLEAPYLGLSALLTTTMQYMGNVIEHLQDSGLRDEVKVFIGGAPVSEQFARKIGADYYCEDAFQAVKHIKQVNPQ